MRKSVWTRSRKTRAKLCPDREDRDTGKDRSVFASDKNEDKELESAKIDTPSEPDKDTPDMDKLDQGIERDIDLPDQSGGSGI